MLLLQEGVLLRLRTIQSERGDGEQAVGPFAGRALWLFASARRLSGWAGGILRVPFADVGPIKVPEGLSDDQVLFRSDMFPTGYMGAEFCDIRGGETN